MLSSSLPGLLIALKEVFLCSANERLHPDLDQEQFISRHWFSRCLGLPGIIVESEITDQLTETRQIVGDPYSGPVLHYCARSKRVPAIGQ